MTQSRPHNIDLMLPVMGRVRFSSETYDRETYIARKAMIRDLSDRLLFPLIRGRIEGRYTTARLHAAYREGGVALADLLQEVKSVSLIDLLAEYEKSNQPPGEKQASQLKVFIDEVGGTGAKLDQLTPVVITNFLGSLSCGPATKNRYRAAISAFCSYLVRTDRLAKHPIAFRSVPKLDEGKRRMPDMTPDEYRRYFEAISPEHRAFFRILIHTGADVSEVHGLTWGDLHFNRELPRIRLKRSKVTRSIERLVPFPEKYVGEVLLHLPPSVSLESAPSTLRVFGSESDDKILWSVHVAARNWIGRPDLRRKDFRHIAAIYWRRAGADLSRIRDWLGHSSIQQTVVYSNFGPDDAYDSPWSVGASSLLSGSA